MHREAKMTGVGALLVPPRRDAGMAKSPAGSCACPFSPSLPPLRPPGLGPLLYRKSWERWN